MHANAKHACAPRAPNERSLMSTDPCTFTLDDLDKHACALLVIDECGAEEAMNDVQRAMVDATERLCAAARTAAVPIIFACDAHIPELDRELLLWGKHCLANTPDALPTPRLGFCDTDHYLPKRRYSAFFQTGLRLLLEELGASTLIVAGFDTNICVRHTLADAYFNNYDTVVPTDATCSFLVGSQEQGLAEIEKCYGTLLASTDDVVAFLEKQDA